MRDHPYTECTSSCVTALSEFSAQFPFYRNEEIKNAITKGKKFILSQQYENGGWYGGWGVCFTYAAWFAISALMEGDVDEESKEAVRRGCDFLLSKQRKDGGWAESVLACSQYKYVSSLSQLSQVVQTSWALLALIKGKCIYTGKIKKAAEFIAKRQMKNGDWEQESICGIFNCSVGISYTNYRNIFPVLALSEYSNTFLPALSESLI